MVWYTVIYFIGLFFYKDIVECANNNGGCHQICVNTMGSFDCECKVGFEFDVDNYTCIGIAWFN